MRQDDTGTTAGIGTFTPAGSGGYSVASELSGLLQSNPEYRKVLDLYAPQYEGRNGIYGAIGSFGATMDPAIMSQKFPTKEAAQAAAQQLMAGVTPDKFSEAIVQGAPQYMSQFKDSSESDDFFGMHTDTLVRGILGVIGGGVASGLGAGAAGSGAAAGGFSSAAMGGNVQDVLRSTATGAAAGYLGGQLGDYVNGAGTVDPYGPGSNWGQDTLTNMGYSPAEIAAIQSGAATVGDAGGIKWGGSGGIDDFTQWAADDSVSLPRTQPGGPAAPTGGLNGNPVDDYITRGGASDGSVPSGNGGYSEATFDGVEQPGMYNGAPPVTTTPNFPEQTVTVRPPSDNVTPPPPAGGLPTLPPPGTNIPTTPVVTSPALPDVPKPNDVEVKGKTDLEKFWDWAKANPKLAMQLFGLGASAFKGGSDNPGAGGPGTGPQAGMTSTPAAPLNRHYVAPPAGYRPGFDPEWQYFQPGPASATPQGTTSTTQPVQNRTGIASVSNTPAFTPGSTIGSSDVKKPLNTRTYVPGPTANMSMDGAPLAPAAPPATPFAGVQGEGGGAPAAANYTWGGAGERQLAYNRGQDVMPMGIKNLADANAQGYFQARDAADGQWVWAKAGDMKAYDTTGMAMQSNGFGTLIPEHSANKNTPK